MALIVWDDLLTKVVEKPFDQAVGRLAGVRDLITASIGPACHRNPLACIIDGEANLLQLRAELEAV